MYQHFILKYVSIYKKKCGRLTFTILDNQYQYGQLLRFFNTHTRILFVGDGDCEINSLTSCSSFFFLISFSHPVSNCHFLVSINKSFKDIPCLVA